MHWNHGAFIGALVLLSGTRGGDGGTVQAHLGLGDTLEVRRSHARDLSSDEVHRWSVTLSSGEYAVVEVHQKGVEVVVRIVDLSGEVQREALSASGWAGTVRARWVAQSRGTWTVEVTAAERSPAGKYQIEWVTRQPATGRDRAIVTADSLSTLALRASRAGEFASAESFLRQARAVLGTAEDADVATVLGHLAVTAEMQGDYEQAGTLFEQSLAMFEDVLDPRDPSLASSLTQLATHYVGDWRFADAEPLLVRALQILQGAFEPNDPDVAGGLNNLGAFYVMQGRYAEAESLVVGAREIRAATLGPGHPDVGISLQNLALLHHNRGAFPQAKAAYERALNILEATLGPDHERLSGLLDNWAQLLSDEGEYAEAERLTRRALAIQEAAFGPDHPEVGRRLFNLAALYHLQGRYDEAEPLLDRAFDITQANEPEEALAEALDNQALLYGAQGRFTEAEALYQEALKIFEERFGSEDPEVAITLNHLGLLYAEQGRYSDAESRFQRALRILEETRGPEHPDVALTLNYLASLYGDQNRYDEARPLLERSIDVLETAAVYPEELIRGLALWARIRKQDGDVDGAMDNLEEALDYAEELRPQLGGGEEARASFFREYSDHFDLMVRWQLEAGDTTRAFEYAERGRARVLLDQLAAGKVDLRRDIPEDIRERLEARERAAKARLGEYQQRLTITQLREDIPRGERQRLVSGLLDSLGRAKIEFSQVYQEIKLASPLWRDQLTSGGAPVPLRTVQRTLTPDAGLILMYQLGRDASYLFVIGGRGESEVYHLDISQMAAARLGVAPGPLRSTAVRDLLMGSEAGAPGLIRVLSRVRSLGTRTGMELVERLHGLWLTLLPDPVRSRVLAASQVVVIPDGALYHLPFEALVLEELSNDGPRFWLDDGPVLRYAPSATALHAISERPTLRYASSSSQDAVLSLSDPVFNPSEVARHAAVAGLAQGEAERPRDAAATGQHERFVRAGGALDRLPHTALETEQIGRATAQDATMGVLELRGVDATERKLRQELPGKRYLHLATHGLVDQKRTALFAALALTPPVETAADSENDGLLQLYEIYDLKLQAELAVLSACETNVGPRIRGEGVFALSRGFLAAGVRRVVASQWQVDDAATAQLMGAFFERLVRAEQAGEQIDFADALRDAKRTVRDQKNGPFFWAPFVITGTQ